MKYYCYNCNNFFEADTATTCPHCHTVGDDIEEWNEAETDSITCTIELDGTPLTTCDGLEYTCAVWSKTKELADLLTVTATLINDDTGEVIEEFNPEQLEYVEVDEEEGSDPYMCCYTGDC